MEAVCDEPPARKAPGYDESPYRNVTCSIARPSRSAVTCVCAVAVPMPISCAGTSTVACPPLLSVIRAAPPGIR